MGKKVLVFSLFLIVILMLLLAVSVSAGPGYSSCNNSKGVLVYLEPNITGCDIDCDDCGIAQDWCCTRSCNYSACSTSSWKCGKLNIGKNSCVGPSEDKKYLDLPIRFGTFLTSLTNKGYYYDYLVSSVTGPCTDATYFSGWDSNFRKCIEIVNENGTAKAVYHGFFLGDKCSGDDETVSLSSTEFNKNANKRSYCGGYCQPDHTFYCSDSGSAVTESGCQENGEVCYKGWDDINGNGDSEETSGFCYHGECIIQCAQDPEMEGKTCLTKEELQNPKTYCPLEGCGCKACVDQNIINPGVYDGECVENSPPRIKEGCSSPCITVASDDNDVKKAWTENKIFYKGLSNGFNIDADDIHPPNDKDGNPTRIETPKDKLVCELSEKNKTTGELTSLAKNGCMPLPWNAGNYKDEDLPLDIKTVFNVSDDGTIVSDPEACKGKKESISQEVDMKVCPSGEIDLGSFSLQVNGDIVKDVWLGKITVEVKKLSIDIDSDSNRCGNIKLLAQIKFDKALSDLLIGIGERMKDKDITIYYKGEDGSETEIKVLDYILNKLNLEKAASPGLLGVIVGKNWPGSRYDGTIEVEITPVSGSKNTLKATIRGTIKEYEWKFKDLDKYERDISYSKTMILDRDLAIKTIQGLKFGSDQSSGYGEPEKTTTIQGDIKTVTEKYYKTIKYKGGKEKVVIVYESEKQYKGEKLIKVVIKKYVYDEDKFEDGKLQKGEGGRTVYTIIETTIDPERLQELLTCCPEIQKIIEEQKQIRQITNKNSVYFVRDRTNFSLDGYIFEFLPPYKFSRDIERIFSYPTYYNANEVDIFYYENLSFLNSCTISLVKTKSTQINSSGGELNLDEVVQNFTAGSVMGTQIFTINKFRVVSCTCINDLKDDNEDGIDCGGNCPNECKPVCYDGIKNGDEIGIDCGGSCIQCEIPSYPCKIYTKADSNGDCIIEREEIINYIDVWLYDQTELIDALKEIVNYQST